MHRVEVAKVEEFKYLASTNQSNRECGEELRKRVQAGVEWVEKSVRSDL